MKLIDVDSHYPLPRGPASVGQALREPVIPCHPHESGEKAGIHFNQESLDSRFRGNDGLSLPIVADCMVFKIDTWKRHQSRFPLSRIP